MPFLEEPAASHVTQATAYIKQRIVSGEFAPGMRLTEEKLARDLGTSRTPVREAMRVLTADGFLLFKPNSGTFVRDFSDDEVREIFDLRTQFESEIAAAAAQRVSSLHLRQLKDIEQQCEELGLLDNLEKVQHRTRLNREFHKIIYDISGRPKLVAALGSVIEMPVVHQTFAKYTREQSERSLQQHREIIAALESGDETWARASMTCHIRAARHALLDAVARTTPKQEKSSEN